MILLSMLCVLVVGVPMLVIGVAMVAAKDRR